MTPYTHIETSQQLREFIASFLTAGTKSFAMDFEEESNLHVYGEHLCLIQLFDGKKYYVIDAWKIQNSPDGVNSLKFFLESPVEKVMFDCSSDAAIVRKTLGSQSAGVFDIRIIAQALGYMGNLTGLVERNLHIICDSGTAKKKYQRANWMKRPLPEEQIEYALDDVKYLFDLKQSLEEEMKGLSAQQQKGIMSAMRNCAKQKHRERPGWEKICNYKLLNHCEKVYIRYFFTARDVLAKKANVPPMNIVDKQTVVKMAKTGTWEGLLEGPQLRYSGAFEQARLKACAELENK